MDAVILAGGLGTRLYPLTFHTPKSLLPFLDRPILEYQLDIAREAGCGNIVLAAGHMAERLVAYSKETNCQFNLAEEDCPLGTGGALANAIREHNLSGPLLMLNGDILCDLAPRSLVSTAQRLHTPITIVGAPVDNAGEFGTLVADSDGRLMGFEEKTQHAPDEKAIPINAGIYLLEESAVKSLVQMEGQFSLETDFFPMEADAGHIGVHLHRGYWRDVGTLERYFKSHFDLLGYYLTMGTSNLGGARDDYSLFRDLIYINRDTQLGEGCDLYHRVVLMKGSIVGSKSYLRNCILLPGAQVGKDCRLESVLIDSETSVPDGTALSSRLLSRERSEPFLL